MDRNDFIEKFIGGVFALIAVIAAIIEMAFGSFSAEAIVGGVKDIFGTLAVCHADAILCIPCRKTAFTDMDTAAAAECGFQKLCLLIKRFLLHEFRSNTFPMIVGIPAEPQNGVDFLLRQRKSEGQRCFALRFINGLDLFFLRREQT